MGTSVTRSGFALSQLVTVMRAEEVWGLGSVFGEATGCGQHASHQCSPAQREGTLLRSQSPKAVTNSQLQSEELQELEQFANHYLRPQAIQYGMDKKTDFSF